MDRFGQHLLAGSRWTQQQHGQPRRRNLPRGQHEIDHDGRTEDRARLLDDVLRLPQRAETLLILLLRFHGGRGFEEALNTDYYGESPNITVWLEKKFVGPM